MTIMDLVAIAAFAIYTLLLIGLVVLLSMSYNKNRKLSNEASKLFVEKAALVARLENMLSAEDSQNVESTEGFLRFVSESRDWAFTYIEDVQQALLAYDIALGLDDAQVLNEAYKKLISYLPYEDMVS
jgi:hypothetical protein